jgi:hypothetical protein
MEQQADFRAARDEVSWFFAAGGAAMGLHGQGFGESSAAGVWDEARSHRAHMGRWSAGHRADVSRFERVGLTLDRLGRGYRRCLDLVYSPFGWGRLGGTTEKAADRANWDVYCRFAVRGRQLLALALSMTEMETAFRRCHREHKDAEVTFEMRLHFVRDQVEKLQNADDIRPGKAFPSGHRLAPALWAAERAEVEAIARYDDIRIDRIRAEHRPNGALFEQTRLAAEERDASLFEEKTGVSLRHLKRVA